MEKREDPPDPSDPSDPSDQPDPSDRTESPSSTPPAAGTAAGEPFGSRESNGAEEPGGSGAGQDFAARLLSAGLSSVFSTQEALRRAVGDALPVEWVQFANQQSERAREDFFARMTEQMASMMSQVDPNEVIKQLLQDHVIEVKASIRLRPADDGGESRIETTIRPDTEDEPS